MKTLYRMLLAAFLAVFIVTVLFFVLVVELLDLFGNLWRYLAHDTSFREILAVAWLYVPKCVSYAIPAGLLFAAAFTLGMLYKNNELIAILGSGISLYRLVAPLILIGAALSVAGFYFEENVVIDSLLRKNELYRAAVGQEVSLSNTNVTVISEDATTIYQADYYNDKRLTITQVVIIRRGGGAEGRSGLLVRIDADWGEWQTDHWLLHGCRVYRRRPEAAGNPAGTSGGGQATMQLEQVPLYDAVELDEPPATFRRTTRKVDEMTGGEARAWVDKLRRAGLPYREALTEYYKKYFFALSPLIVTLVAAGVGGRFKRNVLLMNLLAALVLSVIYYVTQMVALILAKSGYLPPLAGAALAFVLFLGVGGLALRTART
jgi:lipopolysaccharide export system permease protein